MESRSWKIFEENTEEKQENLLAVAGDMVFITIVILVCLAAFFYGFQRISVTNSILFYNSDNSYHSSEEEILLQAIEEEDHQNWLTGEIPGEGLKLPVIVSKTVESKNFSQLKTKPGDHSFTKNSKNQVKKKKTCVCILPRAKAFNHKHSPYPTNSSLEKIIEEVAGKEKFPKDILWAIVSAESDFSHRAVSVEGAVGPAQVTQIAANQVNMNFSRAQYDSYYNMLLAVKYMKFLRKTYVNKDWPRLTDDDRWRMTAFYYNLGPHGAYGRLRYHGFTGDNLTRFMNIYSKKVLGYESHILLSRFNARLVYVRGVIPGTGGKPSKVRVACSK